MIANVVYNDPIYKVNIYINDQPSQWFEALAPDEIDKRLLELGFYQGKVTYKSNGWCVELNHKPPPKPGKDQNFYNGYGFYFDTDHVSDVMASRRDGYSKKKDYMFPAPGTALSIPATQYGNVWVHYSKNTNRYSIWSADKIKLDVMRKKIVEWRRNHSFNIERFV